MATPSLGGALALQAKPIDRTALNVGIIQRQRAEEQEAIDASRNARAKSLENIDKYKTQMSNWFIKDTSGLLANYQLEPKAKVAEIFEHIKKKKGANEHYNIAGDDDLRALKFDLGEIVSRNKISSQRYLKDIERGVNNPDKYDFNTAFTDAVGKGSMEDFQVANDAIHSGDTKG